MHVYSLYNFIHKRFTDVWKENATNFSLILYLQGKYYLHFLYLFYLLIE